MSERNNCGCGEHHHHADEESKYEFVINDYCKAISDEEGAAKVKKLIEEKVEQNNTLEVKKLLFNCIDLTTLKCTDSEESVMAFTEKVNEFDDKYPDLKNVAAICVYPNFAKIVNDTLQVENVGIACVSGGFPSSQTFQEIKVAETAMAVHDGATEIDIVLSVGKFLSGDYEGVCDEIQELKSVCGEKHLKVILETGALATAENIKKASILSIYSGADFIKTSTGKESPAATPEAAYVMCSTIKEYYDKTGRKIGFKPAGGINTVHDALVYYTIVKELLGEEWLNNELFRLGTSRLANLCLSEIVGEEVKFFLLKHIYHRRGVAAATPLLCYIFTRFISLYLSHSRYKQQALRANRAQYHLATTLLQYCGNVQYNCLYSQYHPRSLQLLSMFLSRFHRE